MNMSLAHVANGLCIPVTPATAAVAGRRLSPAATASTTVGVVSLVGAGPGDPELLTIKALRRLEAAEVVLHDALITEEVLSLVPPSAQLISVGKRCGDVKDRGLQQQEIHELLVLHSKRGSRVVRLKCGDPLVFGRGGEELEYCAQHGVPTEVVPGITTALGAAATCQMPLTHRGCANQVRFVVGQNKERSVPDLGWKEMARDAKRQTVVFYMGAKKLDQICTQLRSNDAPGDTPIAVVENATAPGERLIAGTLDTIVETLKDEVGFKGPVIIFVGPTAAFPAQLKELAAGGSDGREELAMPPRKRARVTSPTPDTC